MKVEYDKEVDALYIYLSKEGHEIQGIVEKTAGEYPVNIDFTKEHKPFGIEILDASKVLDLNYLKSVEFKEVSD